MYLDTTPVRTASVPWSGLIGALLAGSLNFQYFQTDPPASPKQLSPTTLECWRPWYLDPGLKIKKKYNQFMKRYLSQFLFIVNRKCQSWNQRSEEGKEVTTNLKNNGNMNDSVCGWNDYKQFKMFVGLSNSML